MTEKRFIQRVNQYYRENKRHLPWRINIKPYPVLVSEFMLQQTQVERVIPFFNAWMNRFPTITILSQASLPSVLGMWSGLGYNRRAKYLHDGAKAIVSVYGAVVPNDVNSLVELKGIGLATAQAIRCYAFNEPVVFIETNIRAVYIHHFFPHVRAVSDGQLLPFVEKTLDKKNPREWYWALMDYGSYLKTTHKNPSRKSSTYAKQAKFEGSLRQLRGKILRKIIESGSMAYPTNPKERKAAKMLIEEQLLHNEKGILTIQNS